MIRRLKRAAKTRPNKKRYIIMKPRQRRARLAPKVDDSPYRT